MHYYWVYHPTLAQSVSLTSADSYPSLRRTHQHADHGLTITGHSRYVISGDRATQSPSHLQSSATRLRGLGAYQDQDGWLARRVIKDWGVDIRLRPMPSETSRHPKRAQPSLMPCRQ